MKYNIPDTTWEHIYRVLLTIPGIRVTDEEATRKFVEAVYYYINQGCKVRGIPRYYGN
jgi:hypothetical protein